MNTQDQDQQIENEVVAKNLTEARVTKDQIDNLMACVIYTPHVRPLGSTSIFVHAFLNGQYYLATGHSACVSKSNFNEELGLKIATAKATESARNKLWELEGWSLYKDAAN